jgi:hypothetical protein
MDAVLKGLFEAAERARRNIVPLNSVQCLSEDSGVCPYRHGSRTTERRSENLIYGHIGTDPGSSWEARSGNSNIAQNPQDPNNRMPSDDEADASPLSASDIFAILKLLGVSLNLLGVDFTSILENPHRTSVDSFEESIFDSKYESSTRHKSTSRESNRSRSSVSRMSVSPPIISPHARSPPLIKQRNTHHTPKDNAIKHQKSIFLASESFRKLLLDPIHKYYFGSITHHFAWNVDLLQFFAGFQSPQEAECFASSLSRKERDLIASFRRDGFVKIEHWPGLPRPDKTNSSLSLFYRDSLNPLLSDHRSLLRKLVHGYFEETDVSFHGIQHMVLLPDSIRT